ncbi:MAG: OsmC family protein [Desulfobacterales bacterium]
MPTATVRWVKDRQFVGTDEGGHSVVLSGDDRQTGVRPSQMLLVALASCTAVDVVEILEKKRKPLSRLDIVITGENDPEPPWAYRTIHVTYRLAGSNLTEKAVSHAIALSEEKYCSVAATVRGVARITTDFEIIPENRSADTQ